MQYSSHRISPTVRTKQTGLHRAPKRNNPVPDRNQRPDAAVNQPLSAVVTAEAQVPTHCNSTHACAIISAGSVHSWKTSPRSPRPSRGNPAQPLLSHVVLHRLYSSVQCRPLPRPLVIPLRYVHYSNRPALEQRTPVASKQQAPPWSPTPSRPFPRPRQPVTCMTSDWPGWKWSALPSLYCTDRRPGATAVTRPFIHTPSTS